MKSKRWLKAHRGYFYILPWLIGFLVFKLYPFGSSLIYSFSDYQLLTGFLSGEFLTTLKSLLTERSWDLS